MVLRSVGVNESSRLIELESVYEAALAALQFELSGFEVLTRWHVDHIAAGIFAEQADELGVNDPTVNRDLVLDELYEGLPHLESPGRVLSHESL